VTLTVYKISYKKEVINIKFLREEGLDLTLMKYVLTSILKTYIVTKTLEGSID